MGTLLDFGCQHFCLLGANHHSVGILSINGTQQCVFLHDETLIALLVGQVARAVDARRLQVHAEHAVEVAVDVDVSPHSALIGTGEVDGEGVDDGIAAVDDHV